VIALRTTRVSWLRRGAAMQALARTWQPGDPVAVVWFSAPTAEDLADDVYQEFQWAPARDGAVAFVRGFQLWLDSALTAAAMSTTVPAAVKHARSSAR
jgi:hypothetical protein